LKHRESLAKTEGSSIENWEKYRVEKVTLTRIKANYSRCMKNCSFERAVFWEEEMKKEMERLAEWKKRHQIVHSQPPSLPKVPVWSDLPRY
jgi:hypothetical protein